MTMGDRIMVINEGILQQIDTPRNLYNNPENVFVAGFIGSPSMNFFDGTVVAEDGKLFVDIGDWRVHAPEERKDVMGPYAGKQVILGIRPENIHGADFRPTNINAAPISATVEVIELLGHELHLYVNSGSNSFVSIVDTRMAPQVGNSVDLVIDVDQMHMFDRDNEQAIR